MFAFAMPPLPTAAQLLPGQILYAGQGILSSSGRFLLAMQTDGNLVLYDLGNGNVAYWASNTSGSGANALAMQGDGNLVVSRNGVAVWSASAGNHIPNSHAVLQDDGNFVLYIDDNETNPVWSSATSTSPSFLASIENSISGAVDSLVSTVGDVPGVSWAGEQLRDFASTSVGQWFLRIVASSVTGALVPYVGPQLASIAFAIPGLAKGDTFASAWTQEEIWRIEQTAQILAGSVAQQLSAAALAELQPYLDQLQGLSTQLETSVQQILADAGGTIPMAQNLIGQYVQRYGAQALARFSAEITHARQDITQAAWDAVMHTNSFARDAVPSFTAPSPFDNVTIRAQAARPGKRFDPITGMEITQSPLINPRAVGGLVSKQGAASSSSTAKTVATGAAVAGAAAIGGTAIAAWLTHTAYGVLWSRIWNATGGRVVKDLRKRL